MAEPTAPEVEKSPCYLMIPLSIQEMADLVAWSTEHCYELVSRIKEILKDTISS